MKKMLVLLAGLAMILCASPAFADEEVINIPYAQHNLHIGGEWWSGLALSNMGPQPINIRITAISSGEEVGILTVNLAKYSTETKLLPDFFPEGQYPTENDGRVSLRLKVTDLKDDSDFGAALFVGNSNGGFGFYSYD